MKWLMVYITVLLYSGATGQSKAPGVRYEDSLSVKQYLSRGKEISEKSTGAAFSWINKALIISENLNYLAGIAASETELGILFFRTKEYQEALVHLERAKPLLQKLNDEMSLGILYKTMGDVYAVKSYFRQSFDYYRDASPLLRKTGQMKLLNECQDAMAANAMDLGRWRGAIEHYKRSLTVKNSLGDHKGAAVVLSKISKLYLTLGKYDSSLLFNKQVQENMHADENMLTDALIDEMVLLSYLGRIQDAESVKQQADKKVAVDGNLFHRLKLLVAKSGFYMGAQDLINSRKYFDSAAIQTTDAKSPELAIYGLSLLEEMSSRNGDSATAYRMIKLKERYKDMFRTENMERLSAEIKNFAEAELREKEIEYLNLVNKLKQQELSQEELKRMALLRENILKDSSLAGQRLLVAALETESALRSSQLNKEKELSLSLSRENELKQKLLNDERRNKNILWLGLAAMALLGTVIFIQFKKQQKKNQIINKQSSELEVLNKEIHHRVKNNLQVISSMLDLQSQTLNDEKATAIIKEGIQRVQSMAFIHQNLYQGNAVNSVNMNEYIKMLSNHLFQTYNIRTDKIRFHTQIEELKLHTDTAIPLGMILNELISNSLKYAFKNMDNGDIWVTMKKNGNELLLQVKDNGIGLPADFNPENSSSFGYEIIKAFSQKLKARMNIDGKNGTDVQIIISKFKSTV